MKQCLALSLAFLAVSVSGAERQADPPLWVNGELALTLQDYRAYLERVPEDQRDEFSASMERVSKTVESLWIQRRIAAKAQAEGLAADPLVAARLRQAQEQVLLEAYGRKLEKDMKYPDLLPRAREVYATERERFKVTPRVHVQHILVDTKCRKRDAALKRAAEIRAQVVAGKEDFTAVARRESDDPSADKNGGDLGMSPPSAFEEQFRVGVAKLTKPGEVSQPIETRFGFHIVRLVEREPERTRPFEEVKDEIIAAEKQNLLNRARSDLVKSVANDPSNQLHVDNLEAIVESARKSLAAKPKPR